MPDPLELRGTTPMPIKLVRGGCLKRFGDDGLGRHQQAVPWRAQSREEPEPYPAAQDHQRDAGGLDRPGEASKIDSCSPVRKFVV